MAASVSGSMSSGKARSMTRCITSVVAIDAPPASRSSEVSAVITASASLGCRSIVAMARRSTS